MSKVESNQTNSNHIVYYDSTLDNEYLLLSNYSNTIILIDNIIYPTIEHYYLSMKMSDVNIRSQIMNAKNAENATTISNQNEHLWNAYWDLNKLTIMERALRVKFNSNCDARELLLSTLNKPIINYSDDPFWGGLNNGLNNLGKLLEKIRNEIK